MVNKALKKSFRIPMVHEPNERSTCSYDMDSPMDPKTIFSPRHPVMFSDDDWGVQSPPKCMVFRFHYHSQKVIGSLG